MKKIRWIQGGGGMLFESIKMQRSVRIHQIRTHQDGFEPINFESIKGILSHTWIRSIHGFEEEDRLEGDGFEVDMDSKKKMDSKWT